MIKIKDLMEIGGAGEWGTDKARKRLIKDTPGQSIIDIGMANKQNSKPLPKRLKQKIFNN